VTAFSNDSLNFKVVVRVRPPLPRELPTEKDESGRRLEFMPITHIKKILNAENRQAFTINVLEYLGQETNEKGR
jgi:hypothetical protein